MINVIDRVKNVRLEHRQRNAEQACIGMDHIQRRAAVAGVHAQIGDFERKFVAAFDLLEQLGHQHGILAARDTYGHMVARQQ